MDSNEELVCDVQGVFPIYSLRNLIYLLILRSPLPMQLVTLHFLIIIRSLTYITISNFLIPFFFSSSKISNDLILGKHEDH